jgi:DivIVA domain-containing protein
MTARFTPVRVREGYDMREVDLLLDELVDALEQGRPVAPLVRAARFTPTRLREGYQTDEVERFLAEMADADPHQEPGIPPGEPTTGPTIGPTTGPSTGPTPEPTTGPTTGPGHPERPESPRSVIEERPGLFARLFGRAR